MFKISEINIDYKISALFGFCALILSFLISVFAGNSILFTLLRTIIFTAIFSAIGYASLFIIKKYVPEVYEIFTSGYTMMNKDNNDSVNIESETSDLKEEEIDYADNGAAEEEVVIDKESETLSDIDIKDSDTNLQDIEPGNNKLDFSEKKKDNFKYEPKIAAQAVRTMMNRDEN